MRRWLSLMTILVLLLCISGIGAEHHKIEDCPADSVCLIFGDDKCTVRGVETGVYAWQKETSRNNCKHGHYGYVYARLDIHPYTRTNWNIVATLLHKGRNTRILTDVYYKPSKFTFHIPSEAGMYRHWKKVDDKIKCEEGFWVANYTAHESGKPARGTHKFNSSEELQCSAVHPVELTSQGKTVIGIASGVGGLMGLGIIVLLILCLLRRRRKAKKFQFGADTTLGTTRAQTPGGKSTEREGTQRALALKIDPLRAESSPVNHTYENCTLIGVRQPMAHDK